MKFNKKLVYFIGIIVLSSAFYACTTKSKTGTVDSGIQHYRHLQFSETPFDLEKGTHKLTDKEAKTINNYRFTYDKSDRLTEVVYCRDTVMLSYGSMRGADKITYTYEGNKQTKHFFNEKNEAIESAGVFAAVYTLNDKGVRTALAFYDKEGNPVENRNKIHRYTWSKSDNGLIKELRYNLADEEVVMNPFCPFYELRFEYDDHGYVTRMMNYQGDTLYNCTSENCGDIGVSYFEFKNNEQGDLISFSVHNTVGQLSNLYWGWAKRVNIVDDNGYVTETAIFDQDDEYLEGKAVPVYKNVYDEHGAIIESWNLDPERKLIDNPNTGVAITEYMYDDKGKRVETLKFDKERKAVVTN